MITTDAWAGRRFAVLGLARSGVATTGALLAAGATVLAWDDDEAARDRLGKAFAASGSLAIVDWPSRELDALDALVVSPGVPLNTHPLAAKAHAAGVPIIGDIELFAQARAGLPPHKVVGITGTNGKSTTTALVHHILQTAGVPSLMGGNIGLPILSQEPLSARGVYVLELSSYQIDLTRSLDCDVAVLLNVTPDHLDRYDGFTAYAASKARLFAMQSSAHVAIVGDGDGPSRGIAKQLAEAGRVSVGAGIGAWPDQARWPALKGPHNARNAAAAVATARALGVDDAAIAEALESFTGLPHRMQAVGSRRGVTFVDDSKATNPESAAPALGAFTRIHWIVGGRAKGDDLDACTPFLDNVAAAYTIGEAGERFAAILRGRIPVVEQAGTLERAVQDAAAAARSGDTVLLSPACASFDQFRDYEARGDAFRAAVEALV